MFKNPSKKDKGPKAYDPFEGSRNSVHDDTIGSTESRKNLSMLSALTGLDDPKLLIDFTKSENNLLSLEGAAKELKERKKAITKGKHEKVFRQEIEQKKKLLKHEIPGKLHKKYNLEEGLSEQMEETIRVENPSYALNQNNNPTVWRKWIFNPVSCLIYFLVALAAGAGEFVLAKGAVSRVFGVYGWESDFMAASVVVIAFLIKVPYEAQIEKAYYKDPNSKIYFKSSIYLCALGLLTLLAYAPIRNSSVAQDQITQAIVEIKNDSQQKIDRLELSMADEQAIDAEIERGKKKIENILKGVSENSTTLEEYKVEILTDNLIQFCFLIFVLALGIIEAVSFAMGHFILKILMTRHHLQRTHQQARQKIADLQKCRVVIADLDEIKEQEIKLNKLRRKARDERDANYIKMQFGIAKAGYGGSDWHHEKTDIFNSRLKNNFPDGK